MKTTIKTLPLSLLLLVLTASSGCQSRNDKPFVAPLPAPRKMAPAEIASTGNSPFTQRQIFPKSNPATRTPDAIIDTQPLVPQLGEKVDESDISNKSPEQINPRKNGIALRTTGEPGLPPRVTFEHFWLDGGALKSDTVYFEFDRADIRSGEVVKIEEVALFLRAKTANAILIDGHCDRRGTEEYNRALGERRALSIREQLIALGVESDRIYTRSFGEDLPAIQGQAENAHEKNRRGEFALLIPRN